MYRYDWIDEIPILKYNPNHDRMGRFSSAGNGGAIQTTHPPGKFGDHGKIDREAGINACAELTHTGKKQAEKMARAAYTFTTGEYSKIRKFQQDGPPPNRIAASSNVEKFIKKSPKWNGGTLYRGIGVDRETADTIVQNCREGKTMGMLGTSSWSSSKKVARMFARRQKADVKITFVTRGKQNGTSVKYLSKYAFQDEVLCSKDARWKPTKVIETKRGYTILCDPVK